MVTRRAFLLQGAKGLAITATGAFGERAHRVAARAGLLGPYQEVSGSRSLEAHARRHGLVYGSAVIIRNVEDNPDYAQLIAEQCGIVVPTNELKWVALRPAPDKFDFTRPDFLLHFAEKHKMLMRGHTLCWHASVPAWIKEPENKTRARQFFVDHITTVCKHFAGKLQSWDVVNEAIDPGDGEPGGLRKTFWYEQVGPDYIDLAYRTARAADPHARLTYNDYGVEYENNEDAEKRRLILEMLRGMRKRGVPVDAVGIQSHIKAAQPYKFGKGLADYMDAIRQMGLDIYLTEMDVNEDDIASDDPAVRDEAVARTYSDYLHVALANPAVKSVLTWDITDRFTWLNGGPTHHRKQPNRPQRSLPFDRDFQPKEAFFAIRESFDQRHPAGA